MDNTVENQIILLVESFINTMIEMHNCGPEEAEELYKVIEDQLLELADKALLLLGGREEYLETMLFQLINQKLPQGAVMDCFGNFREDLDQVIARTLEVYHQREMGLSDAFEDIDDEFSEGVKEEDIEDIDVGPEVYSEEYSTEETIIDGAAMGEGGSLEGDSLDGEDYEIAQIYDAEVVVQESLTVAGKEDAFGTSEDLQEAAELKQEEEESAPDEDTEKDEDLLGRTVRLMFPGKEIISNYMIYDISLDCFVPELDLAFIDGRSTTTITSIGELWLRKAGIAVFKVNTEDIYNLKSFRRQLRRLISGKDFEEKRIFDLSAEDLSAE